MTTAGRGRDRRAALVLGWFREDHAVGFTDRLFDVEDARFEVETADAQPRGLAEAEAEVGAQRDHRLVLDRQLLLEPAQVVCGEDLGLRGLDHRELDAATG